MFTLFSIYYKPFHVPDISYIHPIHAGHALGNDFGIEGDDSGDHISALNPNWVEMTALYYIWKNYPKEGIPYWGMVHYRRYLTTPIGWNPFKRIERLPATEENFRKVLNPELETYIDRKLEEGYVLVPKADHMYKLKRWSVRQQYIRDHDADAWNLMEKAVKTQHPEYTRSFDRFAGGLDLFAFNIMIASWDFWNGYLSFLFPILREVQQHYTIRPDPNQRRVFGFLAERLLNVYVLHQKWEHGQKVKHLQVAYFY